MTNDPATLTEETIFTWGAPPLKFGAGAIEVGFELTAYGVKRVLIVTDPGVNALGAPQRLADSLKRTSNRRSSTECTSSPPTTR